jgi:Spy/CpxP family protein refolding chaperone
MQPLKLVPLLFLSAALALALLVPAASARQRSVMITSEVASGGPLGDADAEGLISSRSLDRYTRPLKLNADQKDAINALHEGYVTAFRDASKARREAIDRLLKDNDDEDDRSVFLTKMPEVQKKHAEQTKKLERSLFSDIKALLAPDQESQWSKVERARRREVGLRLGGLVGGDSADLTSILDDLRLADADLANAAESIEQYEADLDRQLAERDTLKSDFKFEPGKPFDVEAMQASMAQAREQAIKVREVNERHARTIEGHLPEAKRAEFAAAVRRAFFPRIYRPSRAEKDIEAALKFQDLTSDQRKQIETLREQHQRDAAPANDAWAAAQRDADQRGDGGGQIIGPGGAVMRMKFSMGDDQNEKGPLADARKARKDLDKKTRDRLKEILTEAQRDKLPKADSMEESGTMIAPGDARVIRR